MRATLTFLLMLFAWQGPQEGGFEGNWQGTDPVPLIATARCSDSVPFSCLPTI